MAQSRRKKKNPWLKRLLLFVVIPFSVWLVAFLLWFNWSNLEELFSKKADEAPRGTKAVRRGEPSEQSEKVIRNESREKTDGAQTTPPSETRPKEKILDEDRKKLEEILKGQR